MDQASSSASFPDELPHAHVNELHNKAFRASAVLHKLLYNLLQPMP